MADHGKTYTCCQRATDEEMRDNPDIYDCSKCELMHQLDWLWVENAEAWKTYQLLCGRTVRDCQLEGWLLERWTEGWDTDRVIALLDRLDVIAGVLEPATNGPTPTRLRRQ